MTVPLRLLTAIPLAVLAVAVIVVGVQRLTTRPAFASPGYLDLLVVDGRLTDAIDLAEALASQGSPAALRRLIAIADLANETGIRATSLQRLVRQGNATLAEHVEAARSLAAAGARREALTVLYNAEKRFPGDLDMPFLWFYAALALDEGRPELALPLARRLWTKTGLDDSMKLMLRLHQDKG